MFLIFDLSVVDIVVLTSRPRKCDISVTIKIWPKVSK